MGYAFAFSACFACKRGFNYNPVRVPSFRAEDGVKYPVCGDCMELANARRLKMGVQPHYVHPEAYEPCDENEL